MNKEEIERLAREYAEEIYEFSENPFKEDAICEEIDNATQILQWLAETYCIVPKEKVKALCKLTVDNASSIDYGLIDGLYDIMADIFCEEFHEELEKENK